MKKYLIEARENNDAVVKGSEPYNDIWMAFDCDYVKAETEQEAIDLAIDWLKENNDYDVWEIVKCDDFSVTYKCIDSGELHCTDLRAKEVEV